jgi:REP element-mobilizing transposase RayT
VARAILPARNPRMDKKVTRNLNITRRNLPHWQIGGSTYFVTWRLAQGDLSPAERDITLECIQHFHKVRYFVCAAVVMPDHVHLLIRPLEREPGNWWDLLKLVGAMKGVSARKINLLRGTRGALWQDESFDRVIRQNDFEFREKYRYVCKNPYTAGLCKFDESYPWLWLVSLSDGYLPVSQR